MLLSIKEMEVRNLPFAETFPPGGIDFSGADLEQAGPLTAKGVAAIVAYSEGEVRIRGELSGAVAFDCDRCLVRATRDIAAPFDLIYKPAGIESVEEDEEVAIDEGEAEVGFYELPGLLLEDVVREQVLFALPMQRLCREDCRGICPECGGNRNEKPCQCEKQPNGNARWSALKELQIDRK